MMYKTYIVITFFTLLLPCKSESTEQENDRDLYRFSPTTHRIKVCNDGIQSPIETNKKKRLDSQGKVIPLTIKVTKPTPKPRVVQVTPNNPSLNSTPQVETPPNDQDVKSKENLAKVPLKKVDIIIKPSAKPGWKRYLLVEEKTSNEEACEPDKKPPLNSHNVEVCGHVDTPLPNTHTEIQK